MRNVVNQTWTIPSRMRDETGRFTSATRYAGGYSSDSTFYGGHYAVFVPEEKTQANYAGMARAAAHGVSSMAPMINALTSPAITKVQGEYSFDTVTNNTTITFMYYEVDDLEEVAKIYETEGYAVSIMTTQNLFTLHDRLFYDVVQCDEINIAGVTGNDILGDIINRFQEGMRFWHTTTSMGHVYLVSDNYNIKLGQLCIKDNTEV